MRHLLLGPRFILDGIGGERAALIAPSPDRVRDRLVADTAQSDEVRLHVFMAEPLVGRVMALQTFGLAAGAAAASESRVGVFARASMPTLTPSFPISSTRASGA
jgi:hypothetical protein